MKCYRYNPKTFEYIGEEEASKNYATSGNEWLIPGSCTTQQPPAPKNGYVVIFDKKLQSWYHEVDNRETLVTNKETRQTFQYGKIGPIPNTLTTVELNSEYREYVVFDEETQSWIFDETKREVFLEHLWELRKQIRSIKCESDINYNNHLVHVDSTSFNDIMLAFQNAVFMNDMTTTRRWMCANRAC